jgi:hypothetical protein
MGLGRVIASVMLAVIGIVLLAWGHIINLLCLAILLSGEL